MTVGMCEYILCRSALGSTFRASFQLSDGRRGDREVLLCSTHETECRPIRDTMPGKLRLTPDGQVYVDMWMESLVG